MCWADRVGVLWAFVVFAFFFIMAGGNPDPGARALLFTAPVLGDLAIIILPVWVFFRLIDWVSGGPSRRRGQFRGRVVR